MVEQGNTLRFDHLPCLFKGNRELLEHFAANDAYKFIETSLKNWKENQLPLIQYNKIVI